MLSSELFRYSSGGKFFGQAPTTFIVALLISWECLLRPLTGAATQHRRSGAKPQQPEVRRALPVRGPVPTAEADTHRLPTDYTGHNAGTIFRALFEQRRSLAKSQFETTPNYLSRVESVVAGLGVDSQRNAADRLTFVPPDIKATYDADAGMLSLKLDTESVPTPEFFMSGDWGREINTYLSTVIVRNDRTIGSAVGQNAFGVRKRFKIRTYATLRLALPNELIRPWSGGGFKIRATPDEARLMIGEIRLALTGKLAAPYVATETLSDNATITDPEEAHYFDYFLFFESDTLVAYNVRTGEVYSTLDLTEGRQDRARREEEAKREYPPDHIFTSGVGIRRAVLLRFAVALVSMIFLISLF